MNKVSQMLDNIEKYLLFVLLAAMTIIVGMQVIARFILHDSLSWSEEIARYLLVWTTFIGASLGVKQGAHIGVEAFTLLLPKKARKVVNYIAVVLCVIFCVAVLIESSTILQKQIATNQISPAVQMPMWIPYLALPVGTVLMTFRFIQSVISNNKKLSQDAEEGVNL